jgi:c-di-GMP-binding flagellar brake protein YcgR
VDRGGAPHFERRLHTRFHTFLPCEANCGELTFRATLLNLSMAGALLSSGCNPPMGSSLTITLAMPELKKPISLQGQVVRVAIGKSQEGKVYRIGVRLPHVSPDSMRLVEAVARGNAK